MPQHRKQVTYSQRPNHAARSAHARGERQFRTYDTSYIRPKKSKAPAIVAAVLAVLVVGGLAWGALTLFNSCSAQSVELLAEGQEATITVAEGAGAKVVGEQLAEARLVSNAGDFTKRVNEMGVDSQLKPGTYTFAGGMSLDAIINQLTAGPVANALTISEGSTLEAVAQSVATFTENRITRSRPLRRMPAHTRPTTTSWPTRARTAWKASCSRKRTRSATMPRPSR
jgi:UPF0755 protein